MLYDVTVYVMNYFDFKNLRMKTVKIILGKK